MFSSGVVFTDFKNYPHRWNLIELYIKEGIVHNQLGAPSMDVSSYPSVDEKEREPTWTQYWYDKGLIFTYELEVVEYLNKNTVDYTISSKLNTPIQIGPYPIKSNQNVMAQQGEEADPIIHGLFENEPLKQ